MSMRIAPPTLASISQSGVVKPFGPHHREACDASVQTAKTSSRGAFNTRLMTTSRPGSNSAGPLLFAWLWFTMFLLFSVALLQFVQILVKAIEALFPETAVVLQPIGNVPEGRSLQSAGSPLRLAAARDEARVLQHLEVPRDGGHAHLEWLGEVRYRCFSGNETREDGPPRGIGKGCERCAQFISCHLLLNHLVI